MSASDQRGSELRKVAAEKSSFAQTCNLLSQYIKEKGRLRNLNLEITKNLDSSVKLETHQSLLNNLGGLVDPQTSMLNFPLTNNFPKPNGAVSANNCEDDINKLASSSNCATAEAKAAQMTVFYGGRVMVFDDFPVDKARDLFLLASTVSSVAETSFGSPPGLEKLSIEDSLATGSEADPNSGSKRKNKPPPPQNETNSSELPIARRASLHRFLEKRKDRASGRAPYQVQNRASSSSFFQA